MGSSARVKELFHAALELDEAARGEFLRASCADDTGLRRRVERLLVRDAALDARFDRTAPEALSLADDATSLLVGRRIGAYELQRCIAVGGMGAVYEAVQERPQRSVAVKVLRTEWTTDDLRHRFQVESAFLARLQHPGIAHVYEADVALVDGVDVPYIAMELVRGAKPITTYARDAGLAVASRIELFARVCDAVHHGHQRGIIHRDIKPANVLIDESGAPKLIDFGVARAIEREGGSHRTSAGVLLGTLRYMSPEQCADGSDVDVRSDVYSLGVVLYELLCEAPPYEISATPLPHAARIIQEQPPRRPSSSKGELSGDIETIMLEALAKERARRYQSAAALGDDLCRFLAREPIAAHPPSALYRLRLFTGRHKVLAGALVTVFVVALLAAVVSARFAWSEKRAREREEYSSYLANIAAAGASLEVFDAAGARRRLERVPAAQRGWEWAHLERRLEKATRVIEGPLERCGGVVWTERGLVSLWANLSSRWRAALHDPETGEELGSLGPLEGGTNGLAVTKDGRAIWATQTGASGPVLHVWDVAGGSLEKLATGHTDNVSDIVPASDGRIVTTSLDGSLRVHDLEGRTTISATGDGTIPWHAFDVSPAGDRGALGGADGSLRILRMDSLAEVWVTRAHSDRVLAVAFHPTLDVVVSGAADGAVLVWDLAEGRLLDRLAGHESEVRALLFVGEALLSASNDGNVIVWDLATGKPANVLYGHRNWVIGLASSPDGSRVASGAYDGTLRLWDPHLEPGTLRLDAHAEIVREVAFSPDGRWLATASRDGTARVFEAASLTERATLGGHGGRVWSVAFHPQGALLATASDDPLVRIWDPGSGELLHSLEGHDEGVFDVAFSPDGRWLASSSWDGSVILRDAARFELAATLDHGAVVKRIAFLPSSERLATVDLDSKVRVWDLQTGSVLWQREAETRLHTLAASPDGRWIATGEGEYDGTRLGIRLRDAASGAPVRSLIGHTQVVYDVTFAPDGSRLASASADGTVRLWDPRTGEELLALSGHESWVWCVAFSPDGATLASGGGNHDGVGANVRVWLGP